MVFDPSSGLPIITADRIPPDFKKNFSGLFATTSSGIPLIFMIVNVLKVNRKNKKQKRVLVLHSKAVFICTTKGEVHRCFPVDAVQKLLHHEDPKEKQYSWVGVQTASEHDLYARMTNTEAQFFISALRTLVQKSLNYEPPTQVFGEDDAPKIHRDIGTILNMKKPDGYFLTVIPPECISFQNIKHDE